MIFSFFYLPEEAKSFKKDGAYFFDYLDIPGDQQCLEEHGGVSCLKEVEIPGSGRLVTRPLMYSATVNDVRLPDSKPMSWYLEIQMHWTPRKGSLLRPIS